MTLISVVQGNTQSTFEDMRKALGLSRKDLSDLSGLTQAVVWRIEHITVADDQAPYDNIREQLADKPEVVTLFNTLETFALTFPNGKPKPAKKATKAATTITGIDPAIVSDVFETLLAVVTEELDKAKVKKGSTAAFTRILSVLDNSKDVVGL